MSSLRVSKVCVSLIFMPHKAWYIIQIINIGACVCAHMCVRKQEIQVTMILSCNGYVSLTVLRSHCLGTLS